MTRHSALCVAVRQWLELHGCVSFPVKQMGTPRRTATGGVVYVRGALRPGVADVCACGPTGRFIAVEVKVGRDKLRPAQKQFLDLVSANGGLVVVVHDTLDALIGAEALLRLR